MNFLIFGNSITWGAWDTQGGWANRFKNYCDRKTIDSGFSSYFSVYNLGISGDDTENLLFRFENEIKSRFDSKEKNVIIIAIGINDSQVSAQDGSNEISPIKFKENLSKLIKISKNYTQNIVFIGLTPVQETKVNPMPWKETYGYLQKEVEKYNQIIQDVSVKNNVGFIELMTSFLKEKYELLLSDGLHPNDKGHELIYQTIKQYLLEKNLI